MSKYIQGRGFRGFPLTSGIDFGLPKSLLMLYIPVEEKPTVKVNGEEVEAVLSDRVENTYEIEIPGINALCLTDEYTVEINDVTIKLCAFSYCKLAIQHNKSQNI